MWICIFFIFSAFISVKNSFAMDFLNTNMSFLKSCKFKTFEYCQELERFLKMARKKNDQNIPESFLMGKNGWRIIEGCEKSGNVKFINTNNESSEYGNVLSFVYEKTNNDLRLYLISVVMVWVK